MTTFHPRPGKQNPAFHRTAVDAMPAGIFKVCLVVVAAIVNHPLLFPGNQSAVPATDDLIVQKLKEREENLKHEQLELERLLSRREGEPPEDESESLWDFWSVMSMIVFLMIEVWRQDFLENGHQEQSKEEDDLLFVGSSCQGVPLPSKTMLAIFHDQYIRATTNDAARTKEFVEGFADDLLEALRSVCNRDADMEVEDSVCVGSMYENWRVNKPLICDLLVPFAPPEPYFFRCRPWVASKSVAPHQQSCGTILVCGPEDSSGCVCDRKKLGEDMLCLLHNPGSKLKVNKDANLLCSKDSNYLDKDQVMKWFQKALTKAWGRISRKYEFELTFSHLDSPGALRVKFKSGKVISFNISPVVQYKDSDLYFISRFPGMNEPNELASGVHWSLSFTVYERRFLKDVAKHLPGHSCHLSCLQIVTFLHSKQRNITGPSGLTTYHLKTVLLHLLLTRPYYDWSNIMLEDRLRDMFKSLEKCLLEKRLHHFMIGNAQLPETVSLPEHFRTAEPLNLFHPFVLNRDLYRSTLSTFYEMLKNAAVVINEYSFHLPVGPSNKSSH